MDLVETVGKRGNKVPVLLTPEMKKAIDLLITTRNAVGVSKKNLYIFARPYKKSDGYMRASDCLRKVTRELDLELPEAITSTKLRKYVATIAQVIDLKDSELEWLARHMGHDIRIHRQFYRLHDSTLEMAKVGRLLMAVDQGKIKKYAGKTLADISING